ncbi:hypothetical protein [Solicola gregarius]|uniref:DUF3892 domain-containing protein n=1 Tax=Solicola gregarius TaxID=2908642 RepID=A0AA46THY4_9ACTN|nr:hypothetical protein [Solicola gregarius]UYM05641.1 hypothetical protein L0C25_00715 [Solicola gregarius]
MSLTRKDIDGDILAVGSVGSAWSPRRKHDVIVDIGLGLHTYYVPWSTGRSEVLVENGPNGKYLRTDRDISQRHNGSIRSNLNDLPDL